MRPSIYTNVQLQTMTNRKYMINNTEVRRRNEMSCAHDNLHYSSIYTMNKRQ